MSVYLFCSDEVAIYTFYIAVHDNENIANCKTLLYISC